VEVYPGDEKWGLLAFTCKTCQEADAKVAQLAVATARLWKRLRSLGERDDRALISLQKVAEVQDRSLLVLDVMRGGRVDVRVAQHLAVRAFQGERSRPPLTGTHQQWPVKLNLKDKDPELVGLGSYIVNGT